MDEIGGSAIAQTMALVLIGVKSRGNIKQTLLCINLPLSPTLREMLESLMTGSSRVATVLMGLHRGMARVSTSMTPVGMDSEGYDDFDTGYIERGLLCHACDRDNIIGNCAVMPCEDGYARNRLIERQGMDMRTRLYVIYVDGHEEVISDIGHIFP